MDRIDKKAKKYNSSSIN